MSESDAALLRYPTLRRWWFISILAGASMASMNQQDQVCSSEILEKSNRSSWSIVRINWFTADPRLIL